MSKLSMVAAGKAVAHPLRAKVLDALAGEPRSPNELAVEFGEPLGNVSYHVKVLHELGLVELVDTAQRRGAVEHYYRALWQVRVEVERIDSPVKTASSKRRLRSVRAG
jgi:DNA-binding transcriptional ArsR family regulator